MAAQQGPSPHSSIASYTSPPHQKTPDADATGKGKSSHFRELLEQVAAEHERLLVNEAMCRICSRCECPVIEVRTDSDDSEAFQSSGLKPNTLPTLSPSGPYSPSSSVTDMAQSIAADRRFALQELSGAISAGGQTTSPANAVIVTPFGSMAPARLHHEPFRLWPEWTASPALKKGHQQEHSTNDTICALDDYDDENQGQYAKRSDNVVDTVVDPLPCVLNPSSRRRLLWEGIGVLVLFWDLVFIPMQAFNIPTSVALDIINLVVISYWSADIPLNFVTGYWTRKGEKVMGLRLIAVHYCKTWFVADLLIVSIEWLVFVSKLADYSTPPWLESFGVVRMAKFARSLRIIKFLRVLRFQRLAAIIMTVQDNVGTEWMSIILGVCKNIATIVAINHLLGCLWFWIGSLHFTGYRSWVESHELDEQPWGYQYWTAMHWSMTQFTPGSMHVQPQNIVERIFAVIVLLFAMIVFSSFVSSVTNAMARLISGNSDETSQKWVLRTFLKHRNIPHDLKVRVTRYVNFVLDSRRDRVEYKDVSLLKLLSGPLLDDVHYALYMPHLEAHRFFEELNKRMPSLMKKMCRAICRPVLLSQGDTLFSAGETCVEMYFVASGLLLYTPQESSSESVRVRSGRWCCEAVLWSPWHHLGRLCAVRDTELVAVNAAKFRAKVTHEYLNVAFLKVYGGAFVKALNDAIEKGPMGSSRGALSDLQDEIVEGSAGVARALQSE